MSLADDLRPLAYAVRAIPGQLGMRPHRVWMLRRSWAQGQTGDGPRTDVEYAVVESGGQPPKVRWLTEEELAVGQLAVGSVEVGPITSRFPGGGTDLSRLDGSLLATSDVRHVRIRGPMCPDGQVFRVTKLTSDRALHYVLHCSPAGTT